MNVANCSIKDRTELNAQIQEFLDKGGRIKHLESRYELRDYGFKFLLCGKDERWERGSWTIKRDGERFEAQRIKGAPWLRFDTFKAAVEWLEG